MEEKTWTITLADGTKLEGLRLNGNNFVSDVEITEDIFDRNLSEVIISDGATIETHQHMELIQIYKYPDGWYFILRDIPEEELASIKVRADIDYLAAIMDIDLEEG